MRSGPRTLVACLLAVSSWASMLACANAPPPITALSHDAPPNTDPLPPQVMAKLWKVKGENIVTASGEPVHLRGIAFGNMVWDDVEIPSSHHSERDFELVKKMGMNSIRFYMNYRTFEDDGAPGKFNEDGFRWIDQNVEWADKHGLRLVLNMHIPAGGDQARGKGGRLWEDEATQLRFIVLWRTIAERYRAESAVLGYDLLNEPHPTKEKAQWKDLAERTIAEIREVDQHHVIFVERVSAVGGDRSEDGDRNFFRVKDPNVVYSFHFYKPFHFTHQSASFAEEAAREGWYPNLDQPEVDWFQLTLADKVESERLQAGDSEWTLLETPAYRATQSGVVLGQPVLVCDDSGGRAFFDNLSLTKLEPAPPLPPSPPEKPKGKKAASKPPEPPEPTSEVLYELDLDTLRGWSFHHPSGKGEAKFANQGQGDSTSLALIGTVGESRLSSDLLRFFVEAGSEYIVSGVARGIALDEKSNCRLRLELYSSKVPVLPRDKSYLARELDAYLAWGKNEQVPLYLGEFGTIRDSFLPGRGGEKWVKDVLDLAVERELGFAYHDYHDTTFGLFVGENGLPSVYALNQPLYDVLVKTLVGPDADTRLTPPEPVPGAPELEMEERASAPGPKEPVQKDEEVTSENFHDFD